MQQRKTMKNFAMSVVITLVLAGCASAPKVTVDFNPAVDFSSYHTYSWVVKPDGISPLVQQRIVDGISAELRAKGLVPAEQGDIVVAAQVATAEKQSYDTFYSGAAYGGYGRRGGLGMSSATTTVRSYNVGTLVVDLFDAKTQQGIWRGVTSDTIPSSQDKINAMVTTAITTMFADFPPKKTAAK
jgi:hypothetical protein